MSLEEEAIRLVLSGSRKGVAGEKLNQMHKELVADGRPDSWYCNTCTGKLDAVFSALKLKYYHITKTQMATSKYRFTKAAKDNGVEEIVMEHNGRTEVIRADSLTDAQAERVLKNPQFKHNIEPIPTKAEPAKTGEGAEGETKADPAKTAAKTTTPKSK